jgi:hypothetical protein
LEDHQHLFFSTAVYSSREIVSVTFEISGANVTRRLMIILFLSSPVIPVFSPDPPLITKVGGGLPAT